MVYVGRKHRTAGCYFVTHELGRDVTLYAKLVVVHVLAYGHILHLLSDDAALGQRHKRITGLAGVCPRFA